jgi:predicted enzyme related to lactoylglutathione lyase
MSSPITFGGIFLRATDPKALYAWYEQHLGLIKSESGYYSFPVPTSHPEVVFSVFKPDNAYFPVTQHAMLNLQVADLDTLLETLTAAGVSVDPERQAYDFGKFAWLTDPEGNRVELWQPISTD